MLTALCVSTFISGCKDDHDHDHEQELITTLTMTFVSGSDTAVFQFRDLDGDGGLPPVISVEPLAANTTYNVSITLLNEAEVPAEDLSDEIRDEGDEHQFFLQTTTGLNLSFAYADTDDDGRPIGLLSTATTGDSGSGQLAVILRHEPDKGATGVTDGDISNAGGETDIEVTFDVTIQ